MSLDRLKDLIDVAAGRTPPDWVLKNARIVNVVAHEIQSGDVAIRGDRIAGIGRYSGPRTIDLAGRFLCPGFIDAHVHIESSLLCPAEFGRIVLARGTTAIVADPHEFANVLGVDGISYVLDAAEQAPIDIRVMLSSCVPASSLESAGATLTAEEIAPFLSNRRVLGLAEVMNYPGVVAADPDLLQKIGICSGRILDGHAPGLDGNDLNAYAAAGILSDHECSSAEEAREKLRRGLFIMIREGSVARNLDALLPLVTPATADRFMFCTDDKDVGDIIDEGHIDHMVRRAIALGMDPILAVRLASFNTARYFGMGRTGAILPGYAADLVALDDLEHCRVAQVFRRGELVAEDGKCLKAAPDVDRVEGMTGTINVRPFQPADFAIPASPGASSGSPPSIHVIEVLENRIDTERSIERAAVKDGQLVADPGRDLAKLVVVERHRASGRTKAAFARGFKLTRGALAGSVAHDAHNLIAVGVSDRDLHVALDRVAKIDGGLVVVCDGEVLAEAPLPIAGLVSERPAETVAQELRDVTAAAHSLGCDLAQPFMALAFLSLSVIGKLKLTDQGLIDVERFRPISLVAEA